MTGQVIFHLLKSFSRVTNACRYGPREKFSSDVYTNCDSDEANEIVSVSIR
jgi:hypothetical protein